MAGRSREKRGKATFVALAAAKERRERRRARSLLGPDAKQVRGDGIEQMLPPESHDLMADLAEKRKAAVARLTELARTMEQEIVTIQSFDRVMATCDPSHVPWKASDILGAAAADAGKGGSGF
ncbi:hypothetical protein GOB57_21585 [Sinorhizobium meliloti]|nr:hypothetical protein [Sinorhizobium meliloti]